MVKSSLPISLIPALSYHTQIVILKSHLESLLAEQDESRLNFFQFVYKNLQNENYQQIFPSQEEDYEGRGKFWHHSVIGFLKIDKTSTELFNQGNIMILKFIRDQLIQKISKWIFVVALDDILIFSISQAHYLIWSRLFAHLNSLLLSFILVDPSILDSYEDEFRSTSYKIVLNNIKKINRYIGTKMNLNGLKNLSIKLLSSFTSLEDFITTHAQYVTKFELNYRDIGQKLEISNLNKVLQQIYNQEEIEIIKNFSYFNYLDLSPINLLEIPLSFIKTNKLHGQYNSPFDLVLLLVNYSLESVEKQNIQSLEKIKSLKILDPASGTGLILVVALEWLVNHVLNFEIFPTLNSFIQLRKSILLSCISGMDIDGQLIDLSRSFFIKFVNLYNDSENTTLDIHQSNFLQEMVNNQQKKIFSKYDIILSNPPYIPLHSRFIKSTLDQKLKDDIYTLLPNFLGKRDNLYIMFLGIALKYGVKPDGGIIGIVLDRSFLDLPSYSGIREEIIKKFTLVYLLSNYKYEHAVVDLSVIVIQTSKEEKRDFTWQKSLENKPLLEKQNLFLSNPNISYKVHAKSDIRKLLSYIQENSIPLENIAKTTCGLEYGSLLKTQFLSSEKKKNFYPVLDGANGLPQSFVQFWVPNMKNSYVRFSKDYEEYLKKNRLDRSLDGDKQVLLISGNEDRFIQPKIFIRQTASEFIATYDEDGYFGLRNLHTIHRFTSPYSPFLILGILISKLGNWLGHELNIIRTGGKSGHRYPQIRIKDLNQFPVINLLKLNKNRLRKLEELELTVQECLELGTHISSLYANIWNLICENSEGKPFSTQKKLFHMCKKSNKSSFLHDIILNKFSDYLNQLNESIQKLREKKDLIDNQVFSIYNINNQQINVD